MTLKFTWVIALHGNPKHIFILSSSILLSRVQTWWTPSAVLLLGHWQWGDQFIPVGLGLSWFENRKSCVLETPAVLSTLQAALRLLGGKERWSKAAKWRWRVNPDRNAALGGHQAARRCHQGSCKPCCSLSRVRAKLCAPILRRGYLWGLLPHCLAGKLPTFRLSRNCHSVFLTRPWLTKTYSNLICSTRKISMNSYPTKTSFLAVSQNRPQATVVKGWALLCNTQARSLDCHF